MQIIIFFDCSCGSESFARVNRRGGSMSFGMLTGVSSWLISRGGGGVRGFRTLLISRKMFEWRTLMNSNE